MTPGLTGPLHAEGFSVEGERMLLVKLPSGGFGQSERDRSPGCICPALLIDLQSSRSCVRVRSMVAASQVRSLLPLKSTSLFHRRPPVVWRERERVAGEGTASIFWRTAHSSIVRYRC